MALKSLMDLCLDSTLFFHFKDELALPLLAEPYFRMRPFCGVRNVRIRWHIL